MSVHLADSLTTGLPSEPKLLDGVTVRLITEAERDRFDQLLESEHYLKNATAVGQVLRYVAEYRGQWVALAVFSSAAFHLKRRDRWLQWSPRQVQQRRHLIAQNARFLMLASTGQWPNLGSRVLKLLCARLAQDWQHAFGHPVLLVETFVDPQRFRGTCDKAAGWQQLGPTQGFERDWQDFYLDTEHPKQLWVRPLGPRALEQLRAPELPPALAHPARPLPPPCPVATPKLQSLWQVFRDEMTEPRKPRGLRHKLATCLTLIALAVAAGCKGPHAIAEFAQSLNPGQCGHLRCWPRPGQRREYDVPSERTLRRLLKKVNPDQRKDVLVRWMAEQDAKEVTVAHLDGKVLKKADPAPARSQPSPSPPSEIPPELQKPQSDKALTLVNVITPQQRLLDQIVVPQDTNEEGAVAAHWPQMDLAGGTFTITNGGVFGSLLSTPIINPPQSGILGLHAIQDRPVARADTVVVRPMMYLALTYDHRLVDGREAVLFLRRVKEAVENPVRMLIEV